MNRRFLVRTHKLAAEKFVSKLLCLHESAIFRHAYFVRGELNPFYMKESKVESFESKKLKKSFRRIQMLLGIAVRNISQTLVSKLILQTHEGEL